MLFLDEEPEIEYILADLDRFLRIDMGTRTPIFSAFDAEQETLSMYCHRLNSHFVVHQTPDADKLHHFISSMGPYLYKKLFDLCAPANPTTLTYDDCVTRLRTHLEPAVSVITERHHFNSRFQQEGESLSDFVLSLRHLASTCGFGDQLDAFLRDRFITGLRHKGVQTFLLCQPDTLTFADSIRHAHSMLNAEQEIDKLHSSNTTNSLPSSTINKIFPARRTTPQFTRGRAAPADRSSVMPSASHTPAKETSRTTPNTFSRNRPCYRCGLLTHNDRMCPVKTWTCFYCKKVGHTSRVCMKRLNSVHQISPEESDTESVNHLDFLQNVAHTGVADVEIMQVCVNNKLLSMEIDTGSRCTFISSHTYNKHFYNIPLMPTRQSFQAVTGTPLALAGSCIVTVTKPPHMYKLPIYVSQSTKFPSLLGRQWLDILHPEWRSINSIPSFTNQVVDSPTHTPAFYRQRIIEEFADLFQTDTSAIIGYEARIHLQDNVQPIFHKAYPLPYAQRSKVEAELQRLQDLKILTPIKHSEWASPIVVIEKPNGSLRICSDYKVTINKHIRTDHYPLPRFEEITTTVGTPKYFFTIDLSHAFLQLPLSADSKPYMVINTHKGLFQYERMPYGVSSASSIFQEVMDDVIKSLPPAANGAPRRVACFIDDIVAGEDTLYAAFLLACLILQGLRERNIKVNLNKCKFFVPRVDYCGHDWSNEGIAPLSTHVQDLITAPAPRDFDQLGSWLGLANYYHHLLPDLSCILKPLYALRHREEFIWTPDCSQSYEHGKQLIGSSSLVQPFNPVLPITLTTDSSSYGIGVVLSQQHGNIEKPVFFASKTLNAAQCKYSQIEKEAFAIVYGLIKFYKYLKGTKFKLITDHLPLKTIFSPDKGLPLYTTSRLQRWAVILSGFDYTIHHKPSKQIAPADALSRLPVPTPSMQQPSITPIIDELLEDTTTVKFIQMESTFLNHTNIAAITSTDPESQQVLHHIYNGWPNKCTNPTILPFYRRRYGLSAENGLIYWRERILVPKPAQQQILKLLHTSHPGIVKMKSTARMYVWWPNIDADIESYVLKCEQCARTTSLPQQKFTPWPTSTIPFERVHLDFFYYQQTAILLLVDSYSRWLDCWIMKDTTAPTVISKIQEFMCTFGLIHTLVTDNGPPFTSTEFIAFCQRNNIRLLHSPRYHPESNGLAERNVQTVKQLLKKNNTTPSTLHLNLLNIKIHLRNTPGASTKTTPATCILRYTPLTSISRLQPPITTSKPSTPTPIWYFTPTRGTPAWRRGSIISQKSPSIYIVKSEDNVQMEIHRNHVKLDHTVNSQNKQDHSSNATRSPATNSPHHATTSPPSSDTNTPPSPKLTIPSSIVQVQTPRRSVRTRLPIDRYNPQK